MMPDCRTLATIFGMALATYATRAGGYLAFRAIRPSRQIRGALGYIPGALFISYVAPAVAAGGPQQWIGTAATVFLMLWARQLVIAVLGGTVAAWVVWTLH